LKFTAGSDDAGVRLDMALAARPEIASRARAQRLIEGGAVTVGGRAEPKRYRLEPGDRVEVALEPSSAPVVHDVDIPIVYQDEHLLVVDKPAGLVVHPAPGHRGTTLVEIVRGVGGGEDFRPGVVHRLDRDTSGLMILAKSAAAHAALERMIRNREVRREYLALVAGHLDARAGTIDAPIGRDRRNRTIHSTRTDRPRVARTHFTVVDVFARTTLVRARL
jgi:23S rRNA pseudouridine1911/1915/1917 synthase